MDKVLLIIPDNNKGKFITKGYSLAFKELSFFVIEKKIYDLNIKEISIINPDIIFIFWTDILQKSLLIEFFKEYKNPHTKIIHCSQSYNDIPENIVNKKNNNYIYTEDSNDKKFIYNHAADIKSYKTKFKKYKYNITFCGSPKLGNREEILSKLIYNFGELNIFCKSEDFYNSIDNIFKNKLLNDFYIELYKQSYKGLAETQQELADIYISSKINIDLEGRNKKFYNYRCMEITASGGFLICPYNEQIIKHFETGKEIETYSCDIELIDKIRFYLNNLNITQLIAEKGRKNALSNQSVYDKLKKKLKEIYGKSTCNRRRQSNK